MKNRYLLVPAVLAVVGLSACSEKPMTYSVVVKEQVLEVRDVTIREVAFVNNEGGEAVTRVVLNGEAPLAPASMVGYDFGGYRPQIVPGTKGTLEYVHWNNGFSQRYIYRICVDVIDLEPMSKQCAEKS